MRRGGKAVASLLDRSALLALAVWAAACGSSPAPAEGPSSPGPGLRRGAIRGVNHAHIHRRGHGYGSAVSAAELRELRALGVEWVALTPFGYQDRADADRVYGFPGAEGRTEFFDRTDPSMTDTDIAREIAAAHALGMRVLLKPQLWSSDYWDGREWHGTIRQESPEAHRRWWASYRSFVLHYARLAALAGADAFSLGTELVGMTAAHPDEWRSLARDVRAAAPNVALTYSAHWDTEAEAIAFWDALDWVGVGAYYPLDLPDGASIDDLVAAWAPHRDRLAALAERTGKPVVFTEAGYRPAAGTHREPWTYEGGAPDEAAQARAYEALFRAFADEPWWGGVFLWKTFTDPALADGRGDGPGFSFRGREAEAVVHRWYGGRGGRKDQGADQSKSASIDSAESIAAR